MVSRTEILSYIKDKYGIEPDYPWMRTPNYAILRHKNSRKWFVAVIDITEDKIGLNGNELIDVLLLKCEPNLKGLLIDNESIFPAYHMNKEHWITVRLKSVEKEKVHGLIDLSYELTKKTTKPV